MSSYWFEMKGIYLLEKEPGPDGKNEGCPPLCVWGSLKYKLFEYRRDEASHDGDQ